MKKLILLGLFTLLCAGQGFAQDYSDREKEIIALLQETDPRALKDNDKEKIFFLRKINLGLPGGENWLAVWQTNSPFSSKAIVFYAIHNNSVIERFTCEMNYRVLEEFGFDILKDIPGIRISDGSCVIGDYNGDGVYEIFNYAYKAFGTSWGTEFFIEGYDPVKGCMVTYCNRASTIPDLKKQIAPIQFLTYWGRYGFKAYTFKYDVEPITFTWYFYAWNPQTRTYEEVEELTSIWQ
jgi:hypothetical protein